MALFIISKISMQIDSVGFLGGMVDNFSYSHPFVRVWYVFLGMMTGVLFEKIECKWGSLMEKFCVIIALFYFICGNLIHNAIVETPILEDIFTIVTFVLPCYLIFVFAKGKGRVSNLLSRFSFLGSFSSVVYLFHYPIRMMTDWIFTKNGIVSKIGESAYCLEIGLILLFTALFVANYRFLMRKISDKG